MPIKREYYLLWVLFLYLAYAGHAQSKQLDLLPLKTVLSQLEQKFNCRFTYADAVVDPIYVPSIPQTLSLKLSLQFLHKYSGLDFKPLSDNQIVIALPKSTFIFCGYILEEQTKIPVASALVDINGKFVKTDNHGYFIIRLHQKNAELKVRHPAFYRISKHIVAKQNKKCLTLYLTPKLNLLSTVFLHNLMAKGIYKETNGATSINLHKFGILPGLIEPDVLQTLQALPAVESVYEKVSNINIRGGTNDQNLILWDGIRLYQTGHFFGLITAINPLMVHKVSLIENATPAIYTNAVSGTILMNSKKQMPQKMRAKAGVNFINTDIWFSLPVGKTSALEISGRKAISPWVQTPAYAQYYRRILQNTEVTNQSLSNGEAHINFDFYDFSLKYQFRPSHKNFWRLNFMYIADNFQFNKQAVLAGINQNKEGELLQKNMAEGLFWQHKWRAKLTSYFQIYETDYQLKALHNDLASGKILQQANAVSETSVKAWTTYDLKPHLLWTNGYHFIENGTSNLTQLNQPRILSYRREVMRMHSLFSQMDAGLIGQKIKLSLALRYNYLEKFKQFFWSPRFHLNYKFNSSWHFTFSAELKQQFISQIINFQTDFLGIEKRRWRLSNGRNVPVIRSENISAGLAYKHHGWLFNAEIYHKKVKNITTQSQGFVNQYIYTQVIGDYDVSGFEVLLNKRTKQFSVWAAYAYMHNYYFFPDLTEKHFPNNWALKHRLTSGISYQNRNFQTSIGLNWHTGKPTTLPIPAQAVIANQINFDRANAALLPDYLRIDWSANYHFNMTKNVKMELGASIWNLTNRKNILSKYYVLDSNQTLIEYQQKSLRLTPNLSIRLVLN